MGPFAALILAAAAPVPAAHEPPRVTVQVQVSAEIIRPETNSTVTAAHGMMRQVRRDAGIRLVEFF
jgi:hypothetical protein